MLVTVRDGELLAGRSEGKNTYYVPGEKLDAGETALDALVREVQEELGLTLERQDALPLGIFRSQTHGKQAGKRGQFTCLRRCIAQPADARPVAGEGTQKAGVC